MNVKKLQRRLALTAVVLFAGCRGEAVQSALHPAGLPAAKIATLSWVMIIALTVAFVLVMALFAVAIFRRRQSDQTPPPLGRTGFVVAGGVVLPLVVVAPLLIYSLETSAALQIPEDALTVRVVGHQWWWEVHYPKQNITIANEIQIPVGEPVRLELLSADVIHSFWAPALNGKRDLIPGLVNEFWIQADRPGVYRGQCAEYCGLQHAHMAFVVVALPPDEFQEWAAARQAPPPEPDTEPDTEPEAEPEAEPEPAGLAIFLRAGCSRCHTIRGTPAKGKVGPDLTHIGSRETLGAGTVPNTYGNLAGWIGNAQGIKPGVLMPAFYLPPEELHVLTAYLEGLE